MKANPHLAMPEDTRKELCSVRRLKYLIHARNKSYVSAKFNYANLIRCDSEHNSIKRFIYTYINRKLMITYLQLHKIYFIFISVTSFTMTKGE